MASSKYWTKEYIPSKRESVSKFDTTICGDIKLFANGVKLHFTKNGSYQLIDSFNNYITIGGYSKKEKIFKLIDRFDYLFNFGTTKEIGEIIFSFTNRPNIWMRN